ncbi:MAG: LamG domain-containing protein, partial [Nanoarchaeota archaeon]|nr:LamG domain-containing protein [Nanoarchaeota archaeon]
MSRSNQDWEMQKFGIVLAVIVLISLLGTLVPTLVGFSTLSTDSVTFDWNENYSLNNSFVRVSLNTELYDIDTIVVDNLVTVDLTQFMFNSTGTGYVDLIVDSNVVDSEQFTISEDVIEVVNETVEEVIEDIIINETVEEVVVDIIVNETVVNTTIVNNTLVNLTQSNVTTEEIVTIFAAPTQGAPIINSSSGLNVTTDNITVFNQSTAGGDGPVKNIYQWYKNRVPFEVLNMPFEGSSNVTYTKDYTSYSHNGVVTGANWNATGGYDGKGAYEFDGVSDYITIPDTDVLDFRYSDFSMSMWVNLKGTQQTYAGLIGKGATSSSTNPGYSLIYNSKGVPNGTITLYIANTTSRGGRTVTLTDNINDSQWHHIVVTYDRDGPISGYVYNQNIYTRIYTVYNNIEINSTPPISIGSWFGSSWEVNGTLDEIRMFDSLLTSEQISLIYNNQTNKIYSNMTTKGDIWKVQVTPNDGTQDGAAVNVSLIVLPRNIPTQGLPKINASSVFNLTSGNITVFNQSTSSIYDGPVKNIYQWYKNGIPFSVLNMPF